MLEDSKGRLHVLCHSADKDGIECNAFTSDDNKANEEAANIAAAYHDYKS